MDRVFEWDEIKAALNYRKHGIRFEEAVFVFGDPFALSEHDRIERGEHRWQTIGMVEGLLLVLVAHTVHIEETGDEIVRIISARRADRKERKRYEHG